MQIIRLSKVIRELGVGASTAVEFLQKKGYDIDNNLNAKISEEQYNVLQKEFSKDKKQKEESNKFFQERQNNKERNRVTVSTGEQNKKREELIEVTLPETDRPRIKEVGKIDLDALNKRPATNVAPAAKETVIEKAQPEQKVMAEPKKETPVISAPEQKPQVKVVEKVEVSQPAAQSKPAEKPKKTENKPVAKDVKKDLSILKKSAGLTRSLIAKRMNLRITPEIIFELDDSMEYGARIDSILKDIMKDVKKED